MRPEHCMLHSPRCAHVAGTTIAAETARETPPTTEGVDTAEIDGRGTGVRALETGTAIETTMRTAATPLHTIMTSAVAQQPRSSRARRCLGPCLSSA